MKVAELFEDDDTAELKDLSGHPYSGRAWVRGDDAEKALAAVEEGGEGDVILWHDWLQGNAYELHLISKNKEGITKNLGAIKKVAPTAQLHIAHTPGRNEVKHSDWKDHT